MSERRFPRTPDIHNRPFQEGPNPFAEDASAELHPRSSENLYGSPVEGRSKGPGTGHYVATLPSRARSILMLGTAGAVISTLSLGLVCLALLSASWVSNAIYCLPIALLGVAFSIPGCTMGNSDLRAIRAGAMAPQGRRNTRIGFWLGVLGTLMGIFPAGVGLVALFSALFF